MKKNCVLLLCMILMPYLVVYGQNKKIDKAIKKIDASYAAGRFTKASKGLQKLKSSITARSGANNSYLPGIYIREARINLASGVLNGFEDVLNKAISNSAVVHGEATPAYANTLIDVAEIYIQYGNYRISRGYLTKAKETLVKNNQLNDVLKARIALAEAEAMTGQGFCNAAISLLKEHQQYFEARAAEKETIVVDGTTKTQRVAEIELQQRYSDYAKFLMLISNAHSKKGNILEADSAFKATQSWLKKNQRFLGETNLSLVQNNYLYARMLVDNGNEDRERVLEFDRLLNDLKKRTHPTHELGHLIYLDYLKHLLEQGNRARYLNTKLEYQKLIDKYFPKTSLVKINLTALEFDSRLNREHIKDLESDAIKLLASPSLPKQYKTTERILYFLYDVALKEKKYQNAESYLAQIGEIKKELYGETSPEFQLSRVKLAGFYLDYTNKIDEAKKIFAESYLQLLSKEIGAWHKEHLDILNHLAILYEYTDQYELANKTLQKASDIARHKHTDKDPRYGIELDRIAQLELKLGLYEKAEKDLDKSLAILEDNRKDERWLPDYIHALETQAKLFGIKGMFDEAEQNLDRSRQLILKSKLMIGTQLNSAEELSALLIQLGRFAEADELLKEQIPEYQKLFGSNSLRLIEPLINQGRILLAKGDYTEAEKSALLANQIAIKTYSERSTKTAATQKLLADIYYMLGDFDKAEKQIELTLNSQEKQFGRGHVEVAKSLSQLALIKFHKGDNRKGVEKIMLEARDIMASKLGKDNPQYAEILKNVAVLYISEKKYDIAFNSLAVAENIWRAKTGRKNNINTASIYTLTGDVYYQQKNYKKAEEFYNQSKSLYEKFFSNKHPEYVKVLSKLSKVYYMQKDYKQAKHMIEESLANYENFIKQLFPALSERAKAKYWNTIKGDFEFYNSLAFSNLDDFKDLSSKVYNYQLLTKALLLSSSIKIRERIANSTDEQLKTQYNTWIEKKELLTMALSMTSAQLAENAIDVNTLQQEIEKLEKDLSQKSALFGQTFESKRLTFEEVKKSLKANEVAIEMVRYRYFNHSFTDSVIYAAIYLRADFSKPKVIVLKDGKKMETRYFKYYRNSIAGKIHDEMSYGIFWKQIQEETGQASTVYLSADGVYNQINLEAIPTPDGRYIIDNSNIVLVSNTKDLYMKKVKSASSNKENTASVFGNPAFYLTASSNNRLITALPGTEKEVNQVQFMLKQKGWSTAEYVEQFASEEKVKELNSPKIFHIATHGFYKPTEQLTLEEEIEGNEAVLTQNPLLRTGLLLKGAGDLMEKTSYNYNMESGILTAYEAMSLNLDKTDLVVLSACETGLGELEAGEGVYGLQRAFLVAGAKVLIMSMFKVDDDATQKLMLKFYQKWLNSGNLRQSFNEAKKELRVEYPEPIYWGAFIMIGLD